MAEDMNTGELLVLKTENDQTRKILEILRDCKDRKEDLDTAIEKVRALLNK